MRLPSYVLRHPPKERHHPLILYFINARTDIFFQKCVQGDEALFLESTIDRGKACADVGADGIFVPGLTDVELVEKLVAASPSLINNMLMSGVPATGRC
jgi:2-methylisocitrate lyase-like PEP mutase family enzyme